MINVGDLVTRKSHNNDIVFKVINIKDNVVYLKGAYVRLYADSLVDDLVIYDKENDDNFKPIIDEYRNLDRNEYFYLPGRILHIDGDQEYLEQCMEFYKKNRIKAFGVYMNESEMPSSIKSLLEKYNPDILILTGHDSFSRNKREQYKNTSYFVDAVMEARKIEKSHEKLFIIAGACQSNYEDLIKAGANFASSPKRINIHALDPAIVATCLSFSPKSEVINIIKILDKTKYGAQGMCGIISNGSMYVGYPR